MKLAILLIAISLCACGLKANPRPKSSLNIPAPEFELSISESGISIQNNMSNMLVVERAYSEVGDISAPDYDDIAIVPAGAAFLDESSEYGNRYIYRFRTYDDDFNAYSAPVTRIVSYRGVVKLDSVSWTLNEDNICITAQPSQSVDRVQVLIN
ncbi:MAG: hypothetical protein LBV04_05250, partial [Deferribacteraceae bacterium]|nr:hypothetical protein [Deferribacteraceae bacterium]